jgi:hypothetical protein
MRRSSPTLCARMWFEDSPTTVPAGHDERAEARVPEVVLTTAAATPSFRGPSSLLTPKSWIGTICGSSKLAAACASRRNRPDTAHRRRGSRVALSTRPRGSWRCRMPSIPRPCRRGPAGLPTGGARTVCHPPANHKSQSLRLVADWLSPDRRFSTRRRCQQRDVEFDCGATESTLIVFGLRNACMTTLLLGLQAVP